MILSQGRECILQSEIIKHTQKNCQETLLFSMEFEKHCRDGKPLLLCPFTNSFSHRKAILAHTHTKKKHLQQKWAYKKARGVQYVSNWVKLNASKGLTDQTYLTPKTPIKSTYYTTHLYMNQYWSQRHTAGTPQITTASTTASQSVESSI